MRADGERGPERPFYGGRQSRIPSLRTARRSRRPGRLPSGVGDRRWRGRPCWRNAVGPLRRRPRGAQLSLGAPRRLPLVAGAEHPKYASRRGHADPVAGPPQDGKAARGRLSGTGRRLRGWSPVHSLPPLLSQQHRERRHQSSYRSSARRQNGAVMVGSPHLDASFC